MHIVNQTLQQPNQVGFFPFLFAVAVDCHASINHRFTPRSLITATNRSYIAGLSRFSSLTVLSLLSELHAKQQGIQYSLFLNCSKYLTDPTGPTRDGGTA